MRQNRKPVIPAWGWAVPVTVTGIGLLGGCSDYDTPEFAEILPNETAFMVPLEGQTSAQKGFNSEAFLRTNQVAAKRIQVPHRWVQTGRGVGSGRWMPTMRLIKVDRASVAREWTADKETGTSDKNQGIKGESRESINLIASMNCVAMITEANAAKFLYWYGGKPLSDVMDQEIRARVQKYFVQQCAHYTLVNDQLVQHKDEIMATVEKNVIPYFADHGITITVLGLQGEFVYEPKVQEAINARFTVAQELVSQRAANQKTLEKARADAQAAQILASSRDLNNQIRMRQLENQRMALENQKGAIEKWDGKTPTVMGGGNTLFNLPLNETGK